MPRLELILLHSVSADGYNARRLSSARRRSRPMPAMHGPAHVCASRAVLGGWEPPKPDPSHGIGFRKGGPEERMSAGEAGS
jgi:hypothetical protein